MAFVDSSCARDVLIGEKLVRSRVPDAVQRERLRSGAPLIRDRSKLGVGTIPGLQRIISLRFMLRCARETR
jgi:hypothetical protein